MLLSAWYVVLQRVLQLVVLRLRSREFKELEIVVLRHEIANPAPSHPSTGDDDGGPGLLSGRESAVAAPAMERILRQAGHAAGLASAAGRSALDVSATTRSQADEPRGSRADSADRARESAVGLSAHRE